MGMTDMQFKAFLRESIRSLERALEKSPDNDEIIDMLRRYREALES